MSELVINLMTEYTPAPETTLRNNLQDNGKRPKYIIVGPVGCGMLGTDYHQLYLVGRFLVRVGLMEPFQLNTLINSLLIGVI